MVLQRPNQEFLHVDKSLRNDVINNILCSMLILVEVDEIDREAFWIVTVVGNEQRGTNKLDSSELIKGSDQPIKRFYDFFYQFSVDLWAIEEEKRKVTLYLIDCDILAVVLAHKDFLVDVAFFDAYHDSVYSELMAVRCRFLIFYVGLLLFFYAELEIYDVWDHVSEGFIL